MPELPEVETIKRGLQKVIVGRKITKFESRDAKVVRFEEKKIEGLYISNIERRAKILIFYLSNDKAPFDSHSTGSGRVAQGFDGKVLLCHLKMTGQLIWEACPGETEFCLKKIKSPSTPFDTTQGRSLRAATQRVAGGHPSPDWVAKLPNKHTRAIFTFDDKSVLFFNDMRRFGYLKLYDTNVISTPFDKLRVNSAEKSRSLDYARDDNFKYDSISRRRLYLATRSPRSGAPNLA